MTHAHSEHDCWVPVFVAWAEGETGTLDFGGREVPERVQRLLSALEPAGHVMSLTRSGWWLQHPLPCRPALADCPLNLQAESLANDLVDIHGEQAYGKWSVGLDADGRVESVNAYGTST